MSDPNQSDSSKGNSRPQPSSASHNLQPSLILLNGFPGVGKYTIAQKLLKRLGPGSPSRLIDNHLLIDPAEAVEPGRGQKHRGISRLVRKAIFDGIKAIGDPSTTIIMTLFLASNSIDKKIFQEHAGIIRFRGIPLVVVDVFCCTKDNLARLRSSERLNGHKLKLTDEDTLMELLHTDSLIDPYDDSIDLQGLEIHCLEQWTSDMTAEEAAGELLEKLEFRIGFADS